MTNNSSISIKVQKQQQNLILDTILNNVNCSVSHNSKDYLMLIKKQKNKDYCTFFLTDCSDNFWIQKVDMNYCQKLKIQMNVKTKTEVFARHLAQAFGNNPKIEAIQSNARIKLQIKISQGLIINCPIVFNICINSNESPDQYKQLCRNFFKQLYEAKQTQIQTLRKQLQKQKQLPKNAEIKSTDHSYIKNVLNMPQKKQAPPLMSSKNRDLINPHKKKRKQEGLKIVGCD